MIADLEALVSDRVKASAAQIAEFCQRWRIVELGLFGSVLREDFRSESDIDVLVTFAAEDTLTWDDLLNMQEEIEALFGRKVDLVSKKYLKNPYRRHEILKTQKVIYAIE